MADDEARKQDLEQALAADAGAVEAELGLILPPSDAPFARVIEAMRYAAFAGGKRLRPFLVLESARLFSAPREGALRVAAAIEMLHTYSLVHDDLPCMDDDDLRRGKPTTHRAFDEATAVLAGDGLLTLAFGVLADEAVSPDPQRRIRLIARLAEAAGARGMIGGQMMDILAPQATYDRADVMLLQRLKTGALFEFSAEAGAVLAGADEEHGRRLRLYARDMGLAFQIADDLIDATGSSEKAGKSVGKDAGQGKATLLALLGLDGARAEVERLANACQDHLALYGEKGRRLAYLPRLLVDRAH